MKEKPMKVTDRPTEVGVTINNILTFLVLSVMGWVGYNINTMRVDIATMSGYLQTHESRISRTESDVKEIHIKVDGNTREIYKLKGAK